MPSAADPHDIFFTGATDPRHGSVMIGWVGQKPVYFEFETPTIATSETRTTVRICSMKGQLLLRGAWYLLLTALRQIYRNGRQPAAYFEWTMGTHMGMATIGSRKFPMSNLVATGADSQ